MSQTESLTTNSPPLGTFIRREPPQITDELTIKLDDYFVPDHYKDTLQSLMITHGSITDRIEKLAYDINQDYQGNTIHLMCVLKGGSIFFHDLCRVLHKLHDYTKSGHIPFTFDFVRVKSYEGTESSGNVSTLRVHTYTLVYMMYLPTLTASLELSQYIYLPLLSFPYYPRYRLRVATSPS